MNILNTPSHALTTLAATPLPEARLFGISTPHSSLPTAALIGVVTSAVLFTCIALYARSRARKATTDPADHALISLAHDRGLARADVALLRKFAAAHGRAKPVALLLSPSALASARGAIPEKALTPAERKRAERIATLVAQQWIEVKNSQPAPADLRRAA
jgi:hypothetical protein